MRRCGPKDELGPSLRSSGETPRFLERRQSCSVVTVLETHETQGQTP